MESVTRYIETNLLLKVNRQRVKSERPKEIKYLGFTFYKYKEIQTKSTQEISGQDSKKIETVYNSEMGSK